MMAPPGVSAERVKLLRDAYAKTLRDPELLVDVVKSRNMILIRSRVMNCKPLQKRSSINLLKSLKDSRRFLVTDTI